MLDPAPIAVVHRKRRRAVPARVSFAEDVFLYPSDWSIEDPQESWYSTDDLASFKKQRKAVVRALKRADFDTNAVNKEKYCLRGYEPYFSIEINNAVKHSRETLSTMVFSEQKRQKMLNIDEPETIRDCSCNVSEWARDTSHQLGVLDSLECFALTLNLEALSLQAPITGIILAESKTRQAKEQDKSLSVPGAYHVDHAPISQKQDKDTKMRGYEVSSSVKPGAYHVDYRQPVEVSEKQDELRMRGPEAPSAPGAYHTYHQPVADYLQQVRQFSINY
jgi:hypothetical protein